LYLATFVIVFARRPIVPHGVVVAVQPLFVLGLAVLIVFEPVKEIVRLVAAHLAVFFVCALMCHGELARTRPPARYLTAFYLWMSAGGVIGGGAAALIAPPLFNWVAEYPILIALAVLCRPGRWLPDDCRWRAALFADLALVALLLVVAIVRPAALYPELLDDNALRWVFGALLVASVPLWRAPLP